MKQLICCALLLCPVRAVTAQTKVIKPYAPEKKVIPPPVTYSAPPAPVAAETPAEAELRRRAAIAKVQGSLAQPAMSAKGEAPVTYSTNDPAPAAVYPLAPAPGTTMVVNGNYVQRSIAKGAGQEGNAPFTPVGELHFVQFAVYCRDTPVDKAPAIDGLYLLWHPGSNCPDGAKGASYIVKGYTTPEEAKNAMANFKSMGIDCWYNPALSGAEVEIIGIR
ncbi:MAG: hypothetical protein ACR2K1_07870 [Saprospiraceae bacterium]